MPFSANTLCVSAFERRSGAYYAEQIVVTINLLTAFSSFIIRRKWKKVKQNEEKTEKIMKTLKRILKILLVILIALVVGYFIWTGYQV